MAQMTELCVRPYHWEYVDEKSFHRSLLIRIWAMDKNNNNYLLRIENFTQSLYIQLPLTYNQRPVNWTLNSAMLLHESIRKAMRNDQNLMPFDQTDCTLMETLYHVKLHDIGPGGVNEVLQRFLAGDYKKFPHLRLRFKTMKSMYRAQKLFKDLFDRGDGIKIQFNCWEGEINPIFKLLAQQKIHHSSWITVNGIKVADHYKISHLHHEYAITWQTMKKVDKSLTESLSTHPSIIGFDIEAYSDNKGFPKAKKPEHDAICVSVTWGRDGCKKNERHRYIIVQGDINKIPKERFENVKTIRVNNQGELVNWIGYLINGYQANVILTYNGLGFDYEYLNERLAIHDYDWPQMGLIKDEPTFVEKAKGWESAAYGINKDAIVHIAGRLNFDMYKIVRRDFKLSEYKLGKVGLHFKLGTKDDISPEYMFRAYEIMKDALKNLNEAFGEQQEIPVCAHVAYRIYKSFTLGDEEGLTEIFNSIDKRIVALMGNQEFVNKLTAAFEKATERGFDAKSYEESIDAMTKVAIYCIQDVELCFDLYEHFNLWVASNETSNIVGIPIIELYSRGQQIRCLSQLYRSCYKQGIVMDMQPVVPIPFIGGKVVSPEVGLHDNVLVLDFKSLYPLIMCAYNICYTTFVPDHLRRLIPADWCNIIQVNCDENFDPDLDEMDVDEEEIEHIKKKGKKYCDGKKGNYEFWYIKKEIREGILPRLVAKLVNSRDAIVNLFKVDTTLSKDHGKGLVLDKRQLGLKISANSFFGFTGVLKNGKRPFRQGAISITAWGRKSIEKVIDFLKTDYNARIIYGDTDSVMICLDDHIKGPEDCEYWMNRLSKEITDLFPKPMQMKPEYAARMLALMKKKYFMLPMLPNKLFRRHLDGTLMENGQFKLTRDGKSFLLESKGVLSARRDNCEWACEVFDHVAYSIVILKESFLTVINYIIDQLQDLLAGKVNYENFIITRALRDNYKSESYFMKVFSDVLVKLETPAQPGERLAYLVYENKDAKLIGHKMMLRERYLNEIAAGNEVKIDYIYYVDKILTAPVDQLIAAAYRKEINYLHNVQFRRSVHCNFIEVDQPIAMAVQHIAAGRNLEDMRRLITTSMQGYTDDYVPVDHDAKKEYFNEGLTDEILMNLYIEEKRNALGFSKNPVVSNFTFLSDIF